MNIFLNHALCCPHQFNHISSIVHLISWSIYSCVHKSPSVWIVLSQDTHMTHPLKPWFNTFLPTFFLENANNLFFFFFFYKSTVVNRFLKDTNPCARWFIDRYMNFMHSVSQLPSCAQKIENCHLKWFRSSSKTCIIWGRVEYVSHAGLVQCIESQMEGDRGF